MIEPRAMQSAHQARSDISETSMSFARLNLNQGPSGPAFSKVSVGESAGQGASAASGAQAGGLSAILRKSDAPVAAETQSPPSATSGSLLTTDAANRDKQASRSLLSSGQNFPRSSYGSLIATFRDASNFPQTVLEEISDVESEEEDENKEIAVRQIKKAPSKAKEQDPPPAPRLEAIAALEVPTAGAIQPASTASSAPAEQPARMEAPAEYDEEEDEEDYDEDEDEDQGVFADDL